MRLALLFCVACLGGCATADIPQAHRGMKFHRTGALAFFRGGDGFQGPVLNPGSYYVGGYTDVVMVDCSMLTAREPLTALTKDGVQFGLDIYVRFSVECSDQSVKQIVASVPPDKDMTISAKKFYEMFVRPAIGEAVRHVVSPYRANDLNDNREELLTALRKRIAEGIAGKERKVITVYEVNLSNLDFPDAMDAANVDRAVQGVLKDKAIAERERVQAEIETMTLRRTLAEKEGETAAARIDKVGAALTRNPDYLQYDLQSKMPDIYKEAGANGNMVIAAPSPSILVTPRLSTPGIRIKPNFIESHGPNAPRTNPLDEHETRPPKVDP